jgi:hypothetical protein
LIGFVNLGSGNLTAGSSHTMKVACFGNEVGVYHDGEHVLRARTQLTSGTYVGIGTDPDSTASGVTAFDNFTVKSTEAATGWGALIADLRNRMVIA